MAFEYVGLPGLNQTTPAMQPQAQPQQAQSPVSPMQGLGIYNQIAGGGTTGSAVTGATASGGGSGSLASAGPWAALAAVIIGNENEAKEGGYRDEDTGDYAQDLIGGKVLEQDISKRWVPKLFGDDKYGLGADAEVAADLATLDFSNAWDTFKDESTLGKFLGKLI